ncbi:MAG: LysR substrate-binding domain-containing protein [Myxococcota bacterium]
MTEFRHLRAFLALADERHFGRAAERLGVSQPAISRAVASLEKELGVTLVDRTSRSAVLTRAGLAFQRGAIATLETLDHAYASARAGHDGGVRRLRLGMTIGAAQPGCGRLLASFRRNNPNAFVSLVDVDERHLADALARQTIDAAIAWDACVPSGLHTQPVASAPMMILVPQGHPLARQASIGLHDLAPYEVVIPCRHRLPVVFERYRTMTQEAGFGVKLAVDVTSVEQMLAVVAAGAGLGHAPVNPDLRYPGVVVRPQEPGLSLDYVLVWSSRTAPLDALLANFRGA